MLQRRRVKRTSSRFSHAFARFSRGKCGIFDLTLATDEPSCAPAVLTTGSLPYARKSRLRDLDGVLPRRAHRSLCLWRSPVFHHLSFPEEPQTCGCSSRPVSPAAKGNGAASDF